MAWNQPGGGKDPWGGRGGNDQGPPDFDVMLKNLGDKVNRLLGGKGGSSSGSGGFYGLLAIALVVLTVIWAFAGVYRVEQPEQAVKLRFGRYVETLGAGLHWVPVGIESYYVVDTGNLRDMKLNATMITEDQNIVDIQLAVQFRVADPVAYVLRVTDAQNAMKHATESALRNVVGSSVLADVINKGRATLGVEMSGPLQEYLDKYQTGLQLSQVNIIEAVQPKAVTEAFYDVDRAKVDRDSRINEAQAYFNQVVPEARGEAQRVIAESEAYRAEKIARADGDVARFTSLLVEYRKAPQITRQRMYIETMEAVYSNTTKILIDADSGNNLLYLPFDKLMSSAGSGAPSQTSSSPSPASAPRSARPAGPSNTATERLRNMRRSSQEVR